MSARAENEQRPVDFKLEATGGDVLHRWMNVVKEIDSAGLASHLPEDAVLISKGFPENNNGYAGIAGGLHLDFDNEAFSLAIQLYFRPPAPDPESKSVIALDGGGHAIALEALLKSAMRDPKEDLNWAQFKRRLATRTRKKGIELKDEEEATAISMVDGEDTFYVALGVGQSREPLLNVNVSGSMSADKEEFKRKYSKFAEASTLVFDTASKLKKLPLPSGAMELKPAKNLSNQADTFEATVKRATHDPIEAMNKMDENLSRNLAERILVENPDIRFSDIAGAENAKRALKTVAKGIKYADVFAEEGASAPKGILLYGEPGVGKTTLVRALAGEADATFISVRVTDIVHHFVGMSEKLVEETFKLAAEHQPAVLFIDELDALTVERGSMHGDGSGRIVSSILTSIDKLREQNANVAVIGATNRLDIIDPAMTRAGRMDMVLNVPVPDEDARKEGFLIKMREAELKADKYLFDETIDFDQLARATRGKKVADIQEILRRALVEERVEPRIRGEEPRIVTQEAIMEQIRNYESRKQKSDIVAWGAREKQNGHQPATELN